MVIKSNALPSDKDWRYLSIFGSKKRYFNTETYFRESWFDADSIANNNFLRKLIRSAVVILKPEVFATEKALSIVKLIEQYNFRLKAAYITRLGKFQIREIWRYQYSEATIDRMTLVDHLYSLGDTLFTIFEDTSSDLIMPASARLNQLKGASEERLRSQESLRSIIKIPNGVIRLFHISDEPADIIREIGILFDRDERIKIYKDMMAYDRSITEEQLLEIIHNLKTQHIPTSFDALSCWDRILSNPQYKNIPELIELKEKFDKKEFVGWDDIYFPLKEVQINIYDILTIASHMIQQDVDNEFQLIDGDALRGWKDRNFSNF